METYSVPRRKIPSKATFRMGGNCSLRTIGIGKDRMRTGDSMSMFSFARDYWTYCQ